MIGVYGLFTGRWASFVHIASSRRLRLAFAPPLLRYFSQPATPEFRTGAPIQEASSAWNRQRYHSTVEQMQDINWACTLDSHANHKGWNGLGSWGVLDETPMALLSSWFTPIDFRFTFLNISQALLKCSLHHRWSHMCCTPTHRTIWFSPASNLHICESKGTEGLSYILTVPDGYHSQMFCVSPLFHHTTRSRFQLR